MAWCFPALHRSPPGVAETLLVIFPRPPFGWQSDRVAMFDNWGAGVVDDHKRRNPGGWPGLLSFTFEMASSAYASQVFPSPDVGPSQAVASGQSTQSAALVTPAHLSQAGRVAHPMGSARVAGSFLARASHSGRAMFLQPTEGRAGRAAQRNPLGWLVVVDLRLRGFLLASALGGRD